MVAKEEAVAGLFGLFSITECAEAPAKGQVWYYPDTAQLFEVMQDTVVGMSEDKVIVVREISAKQADEVRYWIPDLEVNWNAENFRRVFTYSEFLDNKTFKRLR